MLLFTAGFIVHNIHYRDIIDKHCKRLQSRKSCGTATRTAVLCEPKRCPNATRRDKGSEAVCRYITIVNAACYIDNWL